MRNNITNPTDRSEHKSMSVNVYKQRTVKPPLTDIFKYQGFLRELGL